MKKKEMYKLEFVWNNDINDIVLCNSYITTLTIVRELFCYSALKDILIYDLEGNYQYLKQNGSATYYYYHLIGE
mgnify:CR=1 FL=1